VRSGTESRSGRAVTVMKSYLPIPLGLAAICGAICLAQQTEPPKTEGARDLFFVGSAPKDDLPPVKKPAAAAPKSAPPKTAPTPAKTAVQHLGLRYTLLLVKGSDTHGEAVDASRNFKKGECLAVEIESNRSGYLYVLAKESSGDWTPLFPAADAVAQDNKIDPGQTVRTPKESCFEIEDPPGTESVFVVLSREPREIQTLADSIKAPDKNAPKPAVAVVQTPPAEKVNAAVEQIAAEAGTRDLPFQEAPKPTAAPPKKAPAAKKEPPHSVYVVNGTPKPLPTLVTKIEINHK
jgi:hypothetical protein